MKTSPRPFEISALVLSIGFMWASALSSHAQSATWTSLTSGTWSTGGNWAGGSPANGADNTADFSTLNIGGTVTVQLDTPRTLGNLIFGDTVFGAGTWQLNNNSSAANILTLSTSSGSPTITVNLVTGTTTVVPTFIAAEIAGTQGFTKAGNGTLTLTGANTYSGTTTISAGLLQIGNNGTTGNLGTGPINITTSAGSTGLQISRSDAYTVDNVISGAGGRVTIAGSGTTTFTGSNTYSGATSINNGATLRGIDSTVYAGNQTVRSVFGSGLIAAVTPGAGALQLRANGQNDASAQLLTFNNSVLASTGGQNFTVNVDRESGTGTGKTLGVGNLNLATPASGTTRINVTGSNGYALQATGSNALTMGGSSTTGTILLNPTTANLILSGNVNNSATGASTKTLTLDGTSTGNSISGGIADGTGGAVSALRKANSSTWTLSGSSTYTGGTTIDNGLLQLGNGGATGSIVGNVSTGSSSAILAFNRTDAYAFSGTISGSGQVRQIGSGTTTLSAANTYSGGTTIDNGTLQLGNGGATGSIVGNVSTGSSSAILAFNRTDAYAFSGTISGSGQVRQIGSGTTALSAANTYSGSSVLTAGTLLVNNTAGSGLGTGNVAVNGGTLGGSGSFTGNVTVNAGGRLSPGNSIESLGAGGITFTAGTFEFELNTTSTTADLLFASDSNVALSITTGVPTLSLTDLGSNVALAVDTKLTLISYTNSGGWNGGTFSGFADDSNFTLFGNTWTINYNDVTAGSNFTSDATLFGDRFVTLTVVPEPSALALLAFSLTTVMALRRRRA